LLVSPVEKRVEIKNQDTIIDGMTGKGDKKPQPSLGTPIGQTKRGLGITAIVVDDEFSHRRLMVQILKSIGFNIIGEATNGAEGITLYQNTKPQLVVMDMHMPKMTGLQALKQIVKINPKALVIMSTSENDKETVTELIKSGAKEYIVKPVDRALVIEKMREFVAEHELNK
jgi:two-component system chemotaxis response regulator CheY